MPTRDKWSLCCLRCHAPILAYRLVDDPRGIHDFLARVDCDQCGHFDYLHADSDFLTGLPAKAC